MTPQEQINNLQNQLQKLTQEVSFLRELYNKNNFSNEYIFSQPVTFKRGYTMSGDFVFPEGINIQTGTSTGTQIATSSTQKLGFYGATPVIRQSAGTAATDPSSTQSLVNTLRSSLISLGLIA